eukprot:11161760-Lingulodinium_polyedra.AAC.1
MNGRAQIGDRARARARANNGTLERRRTHLSNRRVDVAQNCTTMRAHARCETSTLRKRRARAQHKRAVHWR